MLNGLPILIVEDEPIIALGLAFEVERFGGVPVGPVPTVLQAIEMLQSKAVGAAMLDANLLDRDVTPVAVALIRQSIPFVIHSAIGMPDELKQLHPDIPVIPKPAAAEAVVNALLEQLAA